MPWERAGVTLQGPGLSNSASLFNRLLCFSIHFIHCYSSASAFLPPYTVVTRQPLLQHSTVVQGTAGQGKVFWHHRPAIKGHCPPLLQQLLHICTSVQNKATKLSMQYKAPQLYSINGNGLLQLHCDLCTVPVSQLVVHAPLQSLQSASSVWFYCDCFNGR